MACLSLEPARFSNTIGFVSELDKNGKRVHVLAYQNMAQNLASGGNAMFLPLPACPGTMSEANVIDTTDFNGFMNDMQAVVSAPLVDPYLAALALGLVAFAGGLLMLVKYGRAIISTAPVTIAAVVVFMCAGVAWSVLHPAQGPVTPQGGTVRVDNLANLIAILKACSVATQWGAGISAALSILLALRFSELRIPLWGSLTRSHLLFLGAQLILCSLVVGPVMDWLIASDRDASLFDSPKVFNSGIYTIVLAADATQIPAALERVPVNKRPKLKPDIFEAYSKWYKGWTFALCCFDNVDARNGAPLLWWYEPLYPDIMFFPALDGHDGNPPVLNKDVDVDHWLVAASDRQEGWQDPLHMISSPWRSFEHSYKSKAAAELLPKKIMGRSYQGAMPQGDFIFHTKDVRVGVFEPARALPPGVENKPAIWQEAEKSMSAKI